MTSFALRKFMSGLRARYHFWSGRRAYRAGRIRTAGRHLDEALSRGHASFDAYLLLGKIAYRERDMRRAAELFHQARCADPGRYALEGFPDDFIASLRARPEAAPRLHYRIVIEPRGQAQAPAGARERSAALRTSRPAGAQGDFTTREEAERLRHLPAIRPGEGSEVDWDDVAKKLFDD
ncbi:MAG: hypothetical protein H6825_13875 [Planctomycetes bacterium]|nr:hypothetical protein [Planctomycetota bacterium]